MTEFHEPRPARPDEYHAALRLAFRHLGHAEREVLVTNALRMIESGALDAEGLLVLAGADGLLGSMVCQPVPGAGGLVWPPQSVEGPGVEAREDALTAHSVAWLRSRGAKLGQALLAPDDAARSAALVRHGFAHVTALWYLRHHLDLSAPCLSGPERLTYRDFDEADAEVFRRTLMRTYEGTHDCPEINGVRDVEEILAGHRAQGAHDPALWWLASAGGEAAGVLLLTDVPELRAWEVAYVGVVPEARRRGYGREMMLRALVEARAAGAGQVTLSVDARNEPAWRLYRELGFEASERREVYLAVWR